MSYMYNVEWKYHTNDPQNDINIIRKVKKKDVDLSIEVEQCGSKSGYGFLYFKTMREAVLNSILYPNDTIFINVSKKERKRTIRKYRYKDDTKQQKCS